MSGGLSDEELERLHEVFLDRGRLFGERLAAFRCVNDALGVVTVPDELESVTSDILGDGGFSCDVSG